MGNAFKKWVSVKEIVEKEIFSYLQKSHVNGYIDEGVFKKSISKKSGVFANLCKWMDSDEIDSISPQAKQGILSAISAENWENICEVFYTDIEFGTGGIRGRVVMTDAELKMLREQGIHAPFLRGPNTINDVVLLHVSTAVAKFAKDKGLKSIVIGYDSRIRGRDFAFLVAELFLYFGFKVFLFDDVTIYPEVTFAIPFLNADLGILISASHNDRRYNGYKLSCGNGSQFSIPERAIILRYIENTEFSEIHCKPLFSAKDDELIFLGGGVRLRKKEYFNTTKNPIDIHTKHFIQVKDFIITPQLIEKENIHVAYSAYNGAGGESIKRLTSFLKVKEFDKIDSLYKVDGMFPAFEDLRTPAGKKVYQQPDPGEPRAAAKALEEYIKQCRRNGVQDVDAFLKNVDALIGTDPDADRAGISVPIPSSEKEIYTAPDFVLLDADTAWAILLWYRIKTWQEFIQQRKLKIGLTDCFIVQSHTTTDIIPLLAEKHGMGWIKTWVGFSQLATGVEKVWKGESISKEDYRTIYDYGNLTPQMLYNFSALEQSNGFSILGGRPSNLMKLGELGHVRDKDGTFAAILFLEVLAYAKSIGKSVLELINENLYLDRDIGLIRTGYRAAPQYGQYEGLEGISKKINIIKKALSLAERIKGGENIFLSGRRVSRVEIYRTGKYDMQHGHTEETGFNPDDRSTFWFPDEGIRFFFENDFNHLTLRPSGTSQSLRFHVQLRNPQVTPENLKEYRKKIEEEINQMFVNIGEVLDVNWEE